ncbi:hypothetical protein Tco_1545942 [Tanacetum coccineum]
MVCPLYAIKSTQSSRFVACDTLMHAVWLARLCSVARLCFRDWLSDALCTKYHIPASVHPSLPGSDKSILQSPDGKIGVYSRFFNFANYGLPLSQFLMDVLGHFRIHLIQLSVFGAAKVSHFEILCRVHGFQPFVNLFRAFYASSYTKGLLSFIKRSNASPVCYSKPLDSVENWNDHFFWVDSTAFPLSVSLKKMDLFAFIRHSDPTKEAVAAALIVFLMREIMLDNAGQEHSTKRDDVQEEVIAKYASEVVVEKPQKKRKRKVVGDASGSALPPKRLKDDHQSLPPSTSGKPLTALRGMVSDDSIIPSDAMRPAVTASVTPTPDVKTVDSVFGLNLHTRHPHVRYFVSLDSSFHSDSYSEAASLVRSVADAPVVTVAVTTTIDANVASGSKAKDVLREIEHIGDSTSAGRIEEDAVSISKLKKPSISSDSFYASQSLDTETSHHVYVSRWKVTNDSVLDDPYVCLGAGVRMRAEHTLEKKIELEDKCAGQANLISERDTEIAHLKSLLSLKEAEATEAISLWMKNAFMLAKTLLDCLVTQELAEVMAFEFFKGQVEKMQDEQVGVLIDRVVAIDSDLMEMALHMDFEFYPRYLTTIADGWSLLIDKRLCRMVVSGRYRIMSGQKEYFGLLRYNPSVRVITLLRFCFFKVVVIGDTSLAFSLEVAHNYVQRLRGDATARRLSLTDSIRPLVEPLSSRVLTGEASSSADITVTTAHATTFAQTCHIPARPSTEVPPSPKIVFEKEELDTTLEHALAP